MQRARVVSVQVRSQLLVPALRLRVLRLHLCSHRHSQAGRSQQQQQQCHSLAQGRRAAARAAAQQTAAIDDDTPRSVLFISSVWPERSSSAAGVRTCDLLDAFRFSGWTAAYASSSTPNEHTAALQQAGVTTLECLPNREQQLSDVVAATQPTAVVFDRFYNEEAFSFRIRELAPHALRILDMQDMHSLRQARQAVLPGTPLDQVLACRPDALAPDCLRELAAIHRSDLTLVCSPVELQLLTETYGVPASKLVLAPFFAPPSPHAPAAAAQQAAAGNAAATAHEATAAGQAGCPGFAERKHFLMIGNWRHPPNLDSARWAATEIWPQLRAALPEGQQDAELHMYGSYASGAAQQLHRPKHGVHMKGFAPSLELMLRYRVLLAPLRAGAGLKGKVVDSWWHGLPVATTPVGAEGMAAADAEAYLAGVTAAAAAGRASAAAAEDGVIWQQGDGSSSSSSSSSGSSGKATPPGSQAPWGGLCGAITAPDVAASAAMLYTDQQLWEACQQQGFQLLQLLYDRQRNLQRVLQAVAAATRGLKQRRQQDYVGNMLWQQQARSTEYFSRWIELKERAAAAPVSAAAAAAAAAAGSSRQQQ